MDKDVKIIDSEQNTIYPATKAGNIKADDSGIPIDVELKGVQNAIKHLGYVTLPLQIGINLAKTNEFLSLGIVGNPTSKTFKLNDGHLIIYGSTIDAPTDGVVKVTYPIEFIANPIVLLSFSCGNPTVGVGCQVFEVDKDDNGIANDKKKTLWIAKKDKDGNNWGGGSIKYLAFGMWKTNFKES